VTVLSLEPWVWSVVEELNRVKKRERIHMDSDKVIKELLVAIFQIESELKTAQSAFEDNQSRGERIRKEIAKIKSEGFEVPPAISEEMHSVTCLREWHWKYIDRYQKYIFESKSIFLDFEKVKDESSIFAKGKRKKALQDVANFAFLGQTYISTLGDVFEDNYSRLIPGETIRSEAIKLMSQRLGAASKARGDDKWFG